MKRLVFFLTALSSVVTLSTAQSTRKYVETLSPTKISLKSYKTNASLEFVEKTVPLAGVVKKADLGKITKDTNSKTAEKAVYGRPLGGFYLGVNHEGGYYKPVIITAGYEPSLFINASAGSNPEWTVNGNAMSADANGNFSYEVGVDIYYMPQIAAGGATYYYGKDFDKSLTYNDCLVAAGIVPEEGTWALTNMDVWKGKLYGGFTNGSAFGTGFDEGKTPPMIRTDYDKPLSSLYVESIDVFLTGYESGQPIPAGEKIDLTIYKINEEGELTEEVLGKSSVSADELQIAWTYETGEDMFYAPFKFKNIDPDTGLELSSGLTLNDAFAVIISGFDKPGFDISFGFSQASYVYNGIAGSALYLGEDGWYRRGYYIDEEQTQFVNAYDLAIQLNGYYNCLKIDEYSKVLIAPDEGGNAYYTVDGQNYQAAVIYSSLPLDTEDYLAEVDMPDWIEMQVDASSYEEDGYSVAVFTVEALPADSDGRTGVVTFKSTGAEASITINQGAAGISSTKTGEIKAINNNGNLELTYPTGVTSVEIVNAAGQLVGNYVLEGTSYVIPAANLAQGLYILKFNGETTSTVKVIK